MTSFAVRAVNGIGEVTPGADLAALIVQHADLRDRDIVVVTSKIVSKAEDRVRSMSKEEAMAAETDRLVARRGATSIVRTAHGLVMAAAGIDASNTEPGTLVLLPEDPDRSARRLREAIGQLTGLGVAVVVSDTSGRAWRHGQTDIAIGAAGLEVIDDHAGRVDAYGNLLTVTAPALADEVAGAGDLVKGKLSRSPVAVLRGLSHLVLPAGTHGPGAAALVREETTDMFGYGAREAVVNAVLSPGENRGFGGPASPADLAAVLAALLGDDGRVEVQSQGLTLALAGCTDPRVAGRLQGGADALARAHGWRAYWDTAGDRAVLRPSTP